MQAILSYLRSHGEYDEVELAENLVIMAQNIDGVAKAASKHVLTEQQRIDYAEDVVCAVESLLALAVTINIPIQTMLAAKIVRNDYDTANLLAEANNPESKFREPQTDILSVIDQVRAACKRQYEQRDKQR